MAASQDGLFILTLKAENIYQFARQHGGVACILNLHFAQHLADDDLNVLVGNINALGAVRILHFGKHIRLHALYALDLEDVIRIHGTVRQHIASFDYVAIFYAQLRAKRDQVLFRLAILIRDGSFALLPFAQGYLAANLRNDGEALRLARLEDFYHARQTLRDILCARNTTGVEGTHGKLCAWFADCLCGNDAYRLADIHVATSCKVCTIALGANAMLATASKHHAAIDTRYPCSYNLVSNIIGNHGIRIAKQLARFRMVYRIYRIAAQNTLRKLFNDLIVVHDRFDHPFWRFPARGKAILLAHDHILGNVHQAARQITGVCRAQRRIGKALARAVRGNKEFKHG